LAGGILRAQRDTNQRRSEKSGERENNSKFHNGNFYGMRAIALVLFLFVAVKNKRLTPDGGEVSSVIYRLV
jgi:hypothetical protein